MDTLIIKKAPGVQIEKNIGRIFRGYNIIEYKSPQDSLNINDYHKVFAYAHLYISKMSIPVTDASITFVVSRHPRDLLRQLEDDPAVLVQKHDIGITYIAGERMPVQITETKLLPEDENLWLNSLRGGLDIYTLRRIANERRQYGSEVDAYLSTAP